MVGIDDRLKEVDMAQWTDIRAELEKLLKLKQKEGETLQTYALRLARRASNDSVVSDDDWERLQEQTQRWVNGVIEDADEKGLPPMLPPELLKLEPTPEPAAKRKAAKAAPAEAAKKVDSGKKKDGKKAPKEAAKPAAVGNGSRVGRLPSKYPTTARIKLLREGNPYRTNTKGASGYSKYREGMTVKQALAAGIHRHQISYDARHGNIAVA